MEEKTELILKPTQVALIIDSDFNIELIIPQLEQDDIVPDHVIFITAIATALKNDDEALIDIIYNFTQEFQTSKSVGLCKTKQTIH